MRVFKHSSIPLEEQCFLISSVLCRSIFEALIDVLHSPYLSNPGKQKTINVTLYCSVNLLELITMLFLY